MKRILLATALVSILFASCDKKENIIPVMPEKPAPEDSTYIINGITDFSISSLDSLVMGFNISYISGKQQKITLSIEGLPNRVKADLKPSSGFPGFSTVVMLTSTVAKPGIYPITIKGTSESGLVKSYKVNLTIKDDFACDSFMLKQFNMFTTTAPGNKIVHKGTFIDSMTVGNHLQLFLNDLFLDTLMGAKVVTGVHSSDEVNFFIDCEHESVSIPQQTIEVYTFMGPLKYKVSGIGAINYQQRAMNINYTVVTEANKTLNYTMTLGLKLR